MAAQPVRRTRDRRRGAGRHAFTTLLDLARDAAHEIERPAAPLTTFLVGVAVGRGATLEGAASTATALLLDSEEPPDAASPSLAPCAACGSAGPC